MLSRRRLLFWPLHDFFRSLRAHALAMRFVHREDRQYGCFFRVHLDWRPDISVIFDVKTGYKSRAQSPFYIANKNSNSRVLYRILRVRERKSVDESKELAGSLPPLHRFSLFLSTPSVLSLSLSLTTAARIRRAARSQCAEGSTHVHVSALFFSLAAAVLLLCLSTCTSVCDTSHLVYSSTRR